MDELNTNVTNSTPRQEPPAPAGQAPEQTQTQFVQYPPQYQQPAYTQYPPQYTQAPYAQQPYPDKTREVLSIGSYIGMFFINMIPIVNIICWIVWLASSNTNKNKKNYIIASIIFSVIISVISGVIFALLLSAGVIAGNELVR